MIEVQCPSCGKRFGAADQHAGRQASCPQCGGPITVAPAPKPAPLAPGGGAGFAASAGGSGGGLGGALGKMSMRLAVPFGIVFYVFAGLGLIGGLIAAMFLSDLSGGMGMMVFLYALLGAVWIFSYGMILHMLAALMRSRKQ